MSEHLNQRAAAIQLVIFDVDGVLTDGRLFVGDDGQEYKAFHSRDGLGMTMLQRSGIPIAIITARESNVVRVRMESLGIRHVYQGQQQKWPACERLLQELQLTAEAVAYVGDDLIDLPIMTRVGLPIAVADAHPLVKAHARWITTERGGSGAAREVCELIMHAQGRYQPLIEGYLA